MAFDESTDVAALEANVGTHADDRITEFSLDALGRTLSTTQKSIATGSVNATNGQLTEQLTDAVTHFVYDGLNNVTRRTDATGATTDITYDGLGRQIREQGPAFTDHTGAMVRSTTDTEYDGLNNVARSLKRGTDDATEIDDRITRYTYNNQGWLTEETDAAGARTSYRHDAAGNVTEQTLRNRLDANGASTDDIARFTYDAMGRQSATGDVASGTLEQTRYNLFGEITGNRSTARDTNGAIIDGPWQQLAQYDRAGRMWKSNGEGATQVFIHDANGNATLKVTSSGTDLSGLSLAQMMALDNSQKYLEVSRFDARNQLVDVFQPTVLTNEEGVSVTQLITQQQGGPFTGGTIGINGTAENYIYSLAPGVAGHAQGALSANATAIYSHNHGSAYRHSFNLAINLPNLDAFGTEDYYVAVQVKRNGNVEDFQSQRVTYAQRNLNLFEYRDETSRGAGNWVVHYTQTAVNEGQTSGDEGGYTSTSGDEGGYTSTVSHLEWQPIISEYNITLYKYVDGEQVYITATGWTDSAIPDPLTSPSSSLSAAASYAPYTSPHNSVSTVAVPPQLVISAQPTTSTSLVLLSRPAGSNAGWTVTTVPQARDTANTLITGTFTLNWSTWARGNYEIKYFALDANGAIVNAQQGSMILSDSTSSTSLSAQGYDGPGRAFMSDSGSIVFTDFGPDVRSMRIGYRAAGSSDPMIVRDLIAGSHGISQWQYFHPTTWGMSGAYEYYVEALDAANNVIKKSMGSFTVGAPNSVSELVSSENAGALVSPENYSYPVSPGSAGQVAGSVSSSGTFTSSSNYQVAVGLPNMDAYGAENFRVQVLAYEITGYHTTTTYISDGEGGYTPRTSIVYHYGWRTVLDSQYAYTQRSVALNIPNSTGSASTGNESGYTYYSTLQGVQVNVFRNIGGAQQQIYSVQRGASNYSHSAPITPTLIISGQPQSTSQLRLLTRPAGTNAGWSYSDIPQQINAAGSPISGSFTLNWSGWARGNYEFKYFAIDASGNILNAQQGLMTLSDSAPSITQSNLGYNGPGRATLNNGGTLIFSELGVGSTSMRIGYRPSGSIGTISTLMLDPGSYGVPGWYHFNPAAIGLSGAYDYYIEALDASGNVIKKSIGSFTVGDADSVSALTSWENRPGLVRFSNQPVGASTLTFHYRPVGSGGAYTTVTTTSDGQNGFVWDGRDLVPIGQTQRFEYQYDVRNANGVLINRVSGQIELGASPNVLSHDNGVAPSSVDIDPANPSALQLVLEYGPVGSGTYTYTQGSVTLTRADASQAFIWSETNGLPTQGGALDYRYTLRDAAGSVLTDYYGQPLDPVVGRLNLGDEPDSTQVSWQIQLLGTHETRIHRAQAYNAFGEVVAETDGRGNTTESKYNGLGLLIEKRNPETDITLANGFVTRGTPTTVYTYDLAGRVIGVRDANGNINTQLWRAGSDGQNGVLTEFHADYGQVHSAYDVFGDLRRRTNEVGALAEYTYDAMSRLVQLKQPMRADSTQAIDFYAYDAAGQRISHTNSLGTEKTFYDSLGRVTASHTALGRITSYSYTWASDLVADRPDGGGWIQTTTRADGHSLTEKTDALGQLLWKQDYGGHIFNYTYDGAGRLVGQTADTGQGLSYSYYANGYLKSIEDAVRQTYTGYEYDNNGNRTREFYRHRINNAPGNPWEVLQNAEITYDELNRMTRYHGTGADIRYEYDANGNRIHMISYYHDGVGGHQATQDYWYAYDTMNRFTVSMGQLSSGGARGASAGDTSVSVIKGSTGIALSYDAASQRTAADDARSGQHETYTYTADGYLENTLIDGIVRAKRSYDAAGRVYHYEEFNAAGSRIYERNNSYDADSRLLSQNATGEGTTTYQYYTGTGTAYAAGGHGELALTTNVNGTTTVNTYTTYAWWDDAKQLAITTSPYNAQSPGWKAGYSRFQYDINGHLEQVDDPAAGQAGLGRSIRYATDAQGLILRRDEMAGGTADHFGVVTGGTVGKTHRYYYKDSARIGDVGNDGQTSGVSYAEQLAARDAEHTRQANYDYYKRLLDGAKKARTIKKLTAQMNQYTAPSTADQYRAWRPISSADFDQNYLPVNADYPGATPTSYTVRTGDTLQGIAAALWGDAAMWYLIADLNGLTGSAALVAGQSLSIPNKIANIHNNANTFMPYNAGEAIGDVSPTLPEPPAPPKPKGGGGCGGAQIIVAIVAVVATIFTAGAAAVAMGAATSGGLAGTFAAGMSALSGTLTAAAGATLSLGGATAFAAAAIGGAVGSIASQLTGMALGVQQKFSWGAVAAGALSTAATAGLGAAAGTSSTIGNALQNPVVFGATNNVVSQGINILTGQQKSFSWKSVAVSAISAGIAHEVGGAMFGERDASTHLRTGPWAKDNPVAAVFAESAVRAGISATTRVAISGGRVSWEAVAADTVSGFVHGMGGVERARQMGRIGADGGLILSQSEALGGAVDTRYAMESDRREIENGRFSFVSGGGKDELRLYTDDRASSLDNKYMDYLESLEPGEKPLSYSSFADKQFEAGAGEGPGQTLSITISGHSGSTSLSSADQYSGTIQEAPGMLSALSDIGEAYFDGRIGFRDAMTMADGQIGGVRNVVKDITTGTMNGLLMVPELGGNAFFQGTLPGEPGYVSIPKFSATGKTGSLQDDISMIVPAILGVRGGRAAKGGAEIGSKLEYFLGRATGSKHNIDRSQEMLRRLENVGLPDTATTRQYLSQHLSETYANPASVLRTQENGRIVRESLLMGPNGAAKIETIWDGNRLITGTVYPEAGRFIHVAR